MSLSRHIPTMRIVAKPIQAYAWYLRPFFWRQRRKYGRVLDAALLWARSPHLFLGVAFLYGLIDRRKSPIDPALRSLVTVRVSQINDVHFEALREFFDDAAIVELTGLIAFQNLSRKFNSAHAARCKEHSTA